MIHINITFEKDEKNKYWSHVDAFVDDENDSYIPSNKLSDVYKIVSETEWALNHPYENGLPVTHAIRTSTDPE